MASKKRVIEAVLPKSSAASAAIALEQAGLTDHEFDTGTTRSDAGPHEILVVVDITGSPDEAEQILIRHGGRLVTPQQPDNG